MNPLFGELKETAASGLKTAWSYRWYLQVPRMAYNVRRASLLVSEETEHVVSSAQDSEFSPMSLLQALNWGIQCAGIAVELEQARRMRGGFVYTDGIRVQATHDMDNNMSREDELLLYATSCDDFDAMKDHFAETLKYGVMKLKLISTAEFDKTMEFMSGSAARWIRGEALPSATVQEELVRQLGEMARERAEFERNRDTGDDSRSELEKLLRGKS